MPDLTNSLRQESNFELELLPGVPLQVHRAATGRPNVLQSPLPNSIPPLAAGKKSIRRTFVGTMSRPASATANPALTPGGLWRRRPEKGHNQKAPATLN